MAEAHLDHPGDVTWFKGYGPLPVVGPCRHNCEHTAISVVGWGPDHDHYCLNECHQCGCRGWSREYPAPFVEGPKFRLLAFSEVSQ